MLYGVGISARRRRPLAATAGLFLCSVGAATVAADRQHQHQHQLLCQSVTPQAALSIIARVANLVMPNALPPPSVRAAPVQRAHIIPLDKDIRLPDQSRLANAVRTHPRAGQKGHRVSHRGGVDTGGSVLSLDSRAAYTRIPHCCPSFSDIMRGPCDGLVYVNLLICIF